MQRPSTQIMVVGHPVIATPFCIICGSVAGLGIIHDGFNGGIAVILLLMGAVAGAARQAGQYRAWKREWDGFDPNHDPSRAGRKALQYVLALPVAAGFFWLFVAWSDPTSSAHRILPLIIVGLSALGLARFVLRRRRRRINSSFQVVTQAISRPLSAPTVAEAYARLPEYLRPIFYAQPERQDQQ